MPKPVPTDEEIESRVISIIATNPSEGHSLHKIMYMLENNSDIVATMPRVVNVINDLVVRGMLTLVCMGATTHNRKFGVIGKTSDAPTTRKERIPEEMVE